MKIKEEAFIFRKLLFMVVFLTISICGCPSKNEILPPTGPRLNPEDLKPGAIGPALEAALNSVLTSQEPSASATCPSQILKALDEIQNFECGAMRVPEFHNKGSVSKNNWALAYLKIFRDKDQKKPLLVIEQGGPGSSSMALAADYVSLIPELLNDFDILAVEQRGTRWTRPVAFCDEIIEYNIKTLSHPKSDETESEIHAKCLAKASEKVNLDSISSYQIAYDLVYSAQHFGYSTFSFFGVSYGTIVGQYLLKFHANSLEKTILDSPVVPGKNWKMDALRGLDDLARKNISNYIATQKNYGVRITVEQIAEDFASLAKSYDKLPLNLSYDYEGKSYPLKFDADHFRSILIRLFLMNYDPELLNVLKQAAASRATHPSRSKEIIAKFAQVFVDVESGNTDIMYEALICREFIVEESKEVVQLALLATLMGESIPADGFSFGESDCRFGFSRLNDSTVIKDPVATENPVLVVGGEIDHVTNPAYVPIVSKNFTRGRQAIFKGVGHGVFGRKDCVNKSILSYLKDDEGRFTNYCEY